MALLLAGMPEGQAQRRAQRHCQRRARLTRWRRRWERHWRPDVGAYGWRERRRYRRPRAVADPRLFQSLSGPMIPAMPSRMSGLDRPIYRR